MIHQILYQARKGEGEEEEEDPYFSSIPEIMITQNAIPHYENLPQRNLHPPIARSESRLEIGSNSANIHPGANLYTTSTGETECTCTHD